VNQEGQAQEIPLGIWDPERFVREVEPRAVELSRGFLRCRPEAWFPGFAAQWMSLAHSLGLEAKLVAVNTRLEAPKEFEVFFGALVDDEPIIIQSTRDSCQALVDCICPSLYGVASTVAPATIMLEYMARRFVASLALAWTGPQQSVVRFDAGLRIEDVPAQGAIEMVFQLNGRECSVWISIGPRLVAQFDGLWRRQLMSTSAAAAEPTEIFIEAAQLAVPPSMLVEYTRSGTIVDLEVPLSDSVVLKQGGRPWMAAKLCSVNGQLAFETLAGTPPAPALPEGTTRLSLQFGGLTVDPRTIAELSQAGAIIKTEIELSDQVAMVINGEVVAEATLCVYEGRLAISVN